MNRTTPARAHMRFWALPRVLLMVWAVATTAVVALPTAEAQSRYSTSEGHELLQDGIEIERESNGDPGKLEDALDKYEEAVARDPDLMPAWARIGYVLYALKRHEEAVERLTDAADRSSDNLEVRQYLGVNLYQLGQEDEAATVLTEVLETRDDLPEALFILGKYHLERRQDDQARPLFERYRTLEPDDPQVYRALATLQLRNGEVDEARESLLEVLDKVPNDVSAHINIGHVEYTRGDFTAAIGAYEKALELDPQQLRVRYDLASTHFVAEEYSRALEQFELVLAGDPRHFSAMYFRAESLFRMGEMTQSRTGFEALIEREPRYVYAYLKLAQIALIQNKEDRALDYIRESGAQTSDDPSVLLFSGVLYRKLGRIEEAMGQHRRLVDLNPLDANGWSQLGRDYLQAFEYNDAAEAFSQATQLDPEMRNAWAGLSVARLQLASAHADRGDFADANDELQQVLTLGIHPAAAHSNLALVALRQNKPDRARKAIDAAAALDPDAPGVARVNGRVLVGEKSYDAAIEQFESVIAADPNVMTGAAWHDLAVAYAASKKPDEAWDAMTNAEELGLAAPKNVALLALGLGMQAARDSDWKKAEELLEKAQRYESELNKEDRVRLEFSYGIVALRNGRFRRAERALEDAATRFDKLSTKVKKKVAKRGKLDVTVELAWAYYENGKLKDALSALGKGKRTGDAAILERAIRERLAIAAFGKGDDKKALSHLEKAAELDSTPATELNLAAVRYGLGEKASAGKIFSSFADQGIAEALYNHGIYLEEVANKPGDAIDRFQAYVDKGGRKADEVRKLLEVKKRVWGTGGGNAL